MGLSTRGIDKRILQRLRTDNRPALILVQEEYTTISYLPTMGHLRASTMTMEARGTIFTTMVSLDSMTEKSLIM
jgi:hypothetical protein